MGISNGDYAVRGAVCVGRMTAFVAVRRVIVILIIMMRLRWLAFSMAIMAVRMRAFVMVGVNALVRHAGRHPCENAEC